MRILWAILLAALVAITGCTSGVDVAVGASAGDASTPDASTAPLTSTPTSDSDPPVDVVGKTPTQTYSEPPDTSESQETEAALETDVEPSPEATPAATPGGTAIEDGAAEDGATEDNATEDNDEAASADAKIIVAPNGPLVGVEFGTEAESAIATFESALGDPSEDSLWTLGCEFSGSEDYERQLEWGPLWAILSRDPMDGSNEHFSAWGVRSETVDGEVSRSDITLPEGVNWDQTIDEVNTAIGGRIVDELGTRYTAIDGLAFYDNYEAPGSAPFGGISIPGMAICD